MSTAQAPSSEVLDSTQAEVVTNHVHHEPSVVYIPSMGPPEVPKALVTHPEELILHRTRSSPVNHTPSVAAAAPPPPTQHASSYLFKRLQKDMPVPTNFQLKLMYGALMSSMVLCGWNDGSLGPLIPKLQEYYNINYLTMSISYFMMFVGSLAGGFTNVWMLDRLGFGLMVSLGALLNVIGFILMGTGGPYAVFLIGYMFAGMGFSWQDAQVNNITTRMPNPAVLMSFVQAAFGLGGMLAPFVSTPFAQHVRRVYFYFFVAAGVGIICIAIFAVSFGTRTEEQIVGKLEVNKKKNTDNGADSSQNAETAAVEPANVDPASAAETGDAQTASEKAAVQTAESTSQSTPTPPTETQPQSSGAKMKRILCTPAVYALMAWSFLYVGVEVSMSGWLTSFLIHDRNGPTSSGYVVTGFWGGMVVGRIILIPLSAKLGNQISIYIFSIIAIALNVVIWTVNNLVANAICYAFVGFFMGPVYPNALMVIAEILDDDLRSGVMGFMGSMGGAGAAAIPFLTGGISDRFGIWTLQPISVSLIAGYLIMWALVPRHHVGKPRAPVQEIDQSA